MFDLAPTDPFPQDVRDEIDALENEFNGLKLADGARLSRYKQYRQEVEQSRAVDQLMIGGGSASGADYGTRARVSDEPQRHNISLPFGMALTVKHAYRIAGRLPDAMVDRREETPQERYRSDTIEKMWWGILRESNGETMFASAGWDGSQLGSACFEVYFDLDKQMPVIRVVDPAGVIVVPGVSDPHAYQRVYRFWQVPLASAQAEYRDHDFRGVTVGLGEMASTHKIGNLPMVTLVQMADKKRTIRFALGSGKVKALPLLQYDHNLGKVSYVVIPNIGPERDIWGWADYEFIRSLADYIPALFSREADILRSVANGAVIEKGTGQDPNVVRQVLAKGGVLPSRKDGSVEPIPSPDIPSFEQEHAARALEMLKMLGFAPDAAWGGSDTRSGADRSLQMQPLVEFTAMKQTNWSAGLKRLACLCFEMIEKKQVGPATFRGSRPGLTPGQQKAFPAFKIGPRETPIQQPLDPNDATSIIELPRTPEELFDGDYSIRFVWQNRIDPDDPAYVLSEMNKFQQGAQSLETTLARLGYQSPEDEIRLIEQEAERIPWLRSGMVALIGQQIQAASKPQDGSNPSGLTGQGNGGGGNQDPLAGLSAGIGMMQGSQGSALGADAAAAPLPGPGLLHGGA